MNARTLLSYPQFLDLPEPETGHYELDAGELIVVSPPKPRNGFICDRLIRHLSEFVERTGVGKIVSNVGFRLGNETVRATDVAFISRDQFKNLDPDEYVEGSPTIAIEVVSPTDSFEDMNTKMEQYLAGGAQSVWIIVPRTQKVEICRAGESRVVLDRGSVITDSVLPGFSLPVASLFE